MKIVRATSAFMPNYNSQVAINPYDDDWIPPLIDEAFVDDILNRIRVKCEELYSRRFPNLFVEFDDEYWGSKSGSGGSMHVTVSLYSNGVEKSFDEFEFHSQDSYWDSSDYEQDINRAVYEFCVNLV